MMLDQTWAERLIVFQEVTYAETKERQNNFCDSSNDLLGKNSLSLSQVGESKINSKNSFIMTAFGSKKMHSKRKKHKKKHTTGGIPRWSPTLVLVARFSAYVWQSGRDAQFSLTCGRMWDSQL
jgi:Tol biopolymer transport system component